MREKGNEKMKGKERMREKGNFVIYKTSCGPPTP